jgi:hypothetical protein
VRSEQSSYHAESRIESILWGESKHRFKRRVPGTPRRSASITPSRRAATYGEGSKVNRADIIRKLHEVADFQLLGGGTWPANRESATSYRKMLRELGLEEDAPEIPGDTRSTALGSELNVDLMTVFAGTWCIWDVPYVLEKNGYLEPEEEDAIYEASSEEGVERLIHRYVLRAYLKFSNHSRFPN